MCDYELFSYILKFCLNSSVISIGVISIIRILLPSFWRRSMKQQQKRVILTFQSSQVKSQIPFGQNCFSAWEQTPLVHSSSKLSQPFNQSFFLSTTTDKTLFFLLGKCFGFNILQQVFITSAVYYFYLQIMCMEFNKRNARLEFPLLR